jgi:hypothetical protein
MPRINYNQIVRDDTFIGQYMSYMSEQETPYAYDFFSALWLMSLALGRECVVARPRAPIHMNLYTILVAESGSTRKSTAVKMATDVARDFAEVLGDKDGYSLYEGRATPESLLTALHDQTILHGHSHVALSVSELAVALGRGSSVVGLPILLTDLYDCPASRRGAGTVSLGASHVANVYLSFLSASTQSWLVRAVNPDVIEGGFTSRVLFVVSERRKRAIAWPDSAAATDHRHLVDKLQEIRNAVARYRNISVSEDARAAFVKWYDTRRSGRDPFRASFAAREDAHVLRIAGFLAVNRGGWEISIGDLRHAIGIVTQVREDGATLFTEVSKAPDVVLAIDAIKRVLLEAGYHGVKQSELTLRLKRWVTGPEIRDILGVMHEYNMVQQFEVPSGVNNRIATVWRATNKIGAKHAVDLLNSRFTQTLPEQQHVLDEEPD